MSAPVVAVAGVGDPGDEHVVRMVDEVVAREGVDELALAAQVRGRDGHELAVARGRRDALGPRQEAVAVGANSAAATRISGSSLVRDASTIAAIAASSPDDESVSSSCMPATIASGADTALTRA